MQKKLLAAAVGAMLIAPAANADVDLYGLLDIGVQLADPGGDYNGSGTFVADTMGAGGSRLGFRASEDLGGGLQALATMELGFFTDTGQLDNFSDTEANKLFQRQVWAGLAGGFGRVTAGRQYRETFLTGTVGSYNYTGSGAGVFFLNTATGVRQDNMIKYTSPAIGPGLTLVASYAPGEGTTADGSDENDDAFQEVALKWGAGPLALAAAFGTSTVEAGGVETDIDTTIVGANYKLGPTKLYALYSATDVDGPEITAMSLGVTQRVGNTDFSLAFGNRENETVGANDNESTLIGVRVDHWLSKATNLFVTYGTMDNDANAAVAAPRQQNGATAGESANAISAGAVVRF